MRQPLSGGSVRETDDRAEALEGANVIYAKSWMSTKHYGNVPDDAEFRRGLEDWCVDEPWFDTAAEDARFMHCLPVAAWRGRCRPHSRRPAQRGDTRKHVTGCLRRWLCCIRCSRNRLKADRFNDQKRHRPGPRRRRPQRHAAPYIRMYKRKTFVVKAGGEAFTDPAQARALLEQMAILHQVGIRLVLVHGAGPQSTARAREQGLETQMVQGRRVTDAATLAVAEEVNAEVREQVAAIFSELGVPTRGLVGAERARCGRINGRRSKWARPD